MRSFTRQAVAGLCLCAGAAEAKAGIALAADGRSDYAIVLPEPATPSQAYAAAELQRIILEMTGARLAVRSDTDALPDSAVLLGITRYTNSILGTPLDLNRLGDDGFRIRTAGRHLVIAGSGVRGTLYGVYELLERYGGCRWYASWHSRIPKRPVWTLPDIDDEQIPAFAMREPFWFDMFDGDFAARCRANGNRMELSAKHGGKIRFGGGLFVHTFYRLMPPAEFFAEHPEYFSEVDGRRTADHAQLCLTNPEVVRICTERLLAAIRQDPDAKLFSVSQNDWRGHCTCAKCRAIDEREGSPAGSLVTFVNQIAEAVEKEYPDVWIETLAYQYTRTPPKTVRPRRNVVPRLCTIECDFSLPLNVSTYDQNRKFVDDIRGWSRITDKLYVWDYTTNFAHYLGPHPNFNCLQGNARFFRDNHVVGLFEQGAYQGRHAEFAELRAWILAKLLWNPDVDVQALYDDFFPGYYGPAAPLVRQYFDSLQALSTPDEAVVTIWRPPTAEFYPDGFFEKALTLWQQAEAAVRDQPTYLHNVRLGAMPVYYALMVRSPTPKTSCRLEGDRMISEADDPRYRAWARELLDRLAEGKNVRVAESRQREASFLSTLDAAAGSFDTLALKAGGLVANICPALGARVCRLAAAEGDADLVDPCFGVDIINRAQGLTEAATTAFAEQADGPAAAVFRHTWRDGYALERRDRLEGDGLHMEAVFRNAGTAEQTICPVVRAGLSFAGGAAACLRIADGPWQTVMVPANGTTAFAGVAGRELAGRTVTLAAPGATQGLSLTVPPDGAERLLLTCELPMRRVLALLLLPQRSLTPNETVSARVTVRPVAGLTDVPPVELPETHSAERLVVEDFMVPIGHYGSWGEHVTDPEAEDAGAAKLFGTHYEWCVQWRIDPKWLTPGAVYALRMRVKVDKSGEPGQAFWAGVYDTGRKRGYGQINPDVSDVKDGYQWYDVTTWTPESGQYIWIGPGVFDLAHGAKSAVRAVYFDRMELLRQRP